MAWAGLTLTVDGRNALNQAQAANRMDIKSVVVGDGVAPSNFRTMKGLVHQLFELTELKIDIVDGRCVLTVDFPKVDYDYYFREIGVMVTTGGGDVLYVYDNCGDDAQYVVTSTGVEETQKRIRISLLISDVANISVMSPSILYVGFDEFDAEVVKLRQAEEDIAALQERTDKLESGKVDKTGDTMTGRLMNRGGTSVYLTTEQSGHGNGFIKVARFENLMPARNHNSPIILELVKRRALGSVILFVSWQGINATNGTPSLRSFGGDGDYGAVMVNAEDDVWDLYVQSQASNAHVEIVRFSKPQYDSGVKVTFYKDQFVTALPSGTVVGFSDWIGNINKNVSNLMDKMAALEAVWPHVMWDTGGWNPFTETAPAPTINDEMEQNEEVAQNEN